MRRLIALILMLILPLQFAWSAAANLSGHAVDDVAVLGVHVHGHDHHDTGNAGHDCRMTYGSKSAIAAVRRWHGIVGEGLQSGSPSAEEV